MFIRNSDISDFNVGGGVFRKVLAYEEEIMVVEVSFAEGGIGAPHTHPHTQGSYVISGKFEVTVGDEKKILTSGDSFSVPSGVLHGVVCIEEGKLIDFFTPMRRDFIE